MKTIIKEATVTTARGTEINITVTATRGAETKEENVYCDGYNMPVKKGGRDRKNKHHPELYRADIVGMPHTEKTEPKNAGILRLFFR